MPYIVHDGDTIRHGMLDTARFIGDFQELQAEAAQQRRYAHAGAAAAAQCFANSSQSALDYVQGERKGVPTMEAPSNAVLFTAAHPDQAAVMDILDGRVEGDTVTLTVLLVDEPQLDGYHYHFPTACSATQLALDFVLPSAGGQGDMTVSGAFSLHIKLSCIYMCG
ncbi:disintegrin and metallo ase domain-containing 25-like [Chlorella sorokiniana]|uniref:Disintegrin and metallo ase domain-containing 25-like n=1 Tax=Chlorella sorokiniana TaxID=3076 RepID=A0A2P6TQX2_CHLSO|nr:disintegrin and metallo ase domain-containing 25-like [Chlorella sorokiniana]|eukprot:PRW56462.1 disintegrin and metallo ase domain-containing 25-like [Chlorella sorokiniana]